MPTEGESGTESEMAIPPRITGDKKFFQFQYNFESTGEKPLATIPEGAFRRRKRHGMKKERNLSMESIKIRFGNADEVWKFVNTIRRFNGEYASMAGSYTVDAKSILGV